MSLSLTQKRFGSRETPDFSNNYSQVNDNGYI